MTPDPATGQSSVQADVIPLMGISCYCSGLCSERESSVASAVGTYLFALILRARRLSARSSGQASPVEACHPRRQIISEPCSFVVHVILVATKYFWRGFYSQEDLAQYGEVYARPG